MLGSMLDGASMATAPNVSFQTHRKLDKLDTLSMGDPMALVAA